MALCVQSLNASPLSKHDGTQLKDLEAFHVLQSVTRPPVPSVYITPARLSTARLLQATEPSHAESPSGKPTPSIYRILRGPVSRTPVPQVLDPKVIRRPHGN